MRSSYYGGALWQKFKGAIKKCQHCGEEFKVPPCRAESANYCSKECADNYRGATLKRNKVELVCETCGVTFSRHRSQSIGARYCSQACKNEMQRINPEFSEKIAGPKNPMWKGGAF